MGPLKKFSQFCPAVGVPAIGNKIYTNIYIYYIYYVPRARYVDEVKHFFKGFLFNEPEKYPIRYIVVKI